MILSKKPVIAMISVHGDPAAPIGKEEAGGQNVYVLEVAKALASKGWHVDMFTRRTSPDEPMVVEHAHGCRTIRLTAGPQSFIPRDEIFGYLSEFVKSFLIFQQQSGRDYSLVHTNYWLSSWVGLELKKRLGIGQVHTYHSVGAVKYQSTAAIPDIANTRLAVEKRCLETVDCVVATSPQEQKHLQTLVSPLGNIQIIPCGTDVNRFGQYSQAEAKQKLGFQIDQHIVFYIGRFDPRKGIETLVNAVHRSTGFNPSQDRLIIGGGSRPGQKDGHERERIENIVNALGMEKWTQFPGRISDADLPLYYTAADVVVVPSHYEPFGLVAIEAMACGTPVIASRVGGLEFTVVDQQTGLLATPRSTESFAQALDQILENPAWRDQLGIAARQRVEEHFSWQGVALQLSELYQAIQTASPKKQPVFK